MIDNLKYIQNWEIFSSCPSPNVQPMCPYHAEIILLSLPHMLIWSSIHKILSQRPSVRAKYSSVWRYLLNSTLPKPVFPGDDGQQHLWCSGAPYQTWKGHHLFSILHLLLHHSTVVYIGLNAPYGLYLHAFYVLKDMQIKPELHHAIAERKDYSD